LNRLVKSKVGPYFRWAVADSMADVVFDFTFSKFPVMFAVFLLSVSMSTSGAFGFLATLVLYLAKVCTRCCTLLSASIADIVIVKMMVTNDLYMVHTLLKLCECILDFQNVRKPAIRFMERKNIPCERRTITPKLPFHLCHVVVYPRVLECS